MSAYLCQFWGRIDSPLPEIIWHIKVPSRIRFFSWLCVHGKCSTADNLSKRGWPHNSVCQLCHLGWEDGLHLVSSCPFTAEIWGYCLAIYNFSFNLLPSAHTGSILDSWLKALDGIGRKNTSRKKGLGHRAVFTLAPVQSRTGTNVSIGPGS